MIRRAIASAVAVLACVSVAACTSSGSPHDLGSDSTSTTTRTLTSGPDGLINTGPTTVAVAKSCPFVARQAVQEAVGMRLARITVLRSGGHVVGCRIYAVQGTIYNQSEDLPPANQPVIELKLARYAKALGAHNAVALIARKGANPQQATIQGVTGVCFQTAFYKKDAGQDWACAWNKGTTYALLKTVVTIPALNAIRVARAIHLPK